MSRIVELLSELKDIDADDGGAFPYDDSRKLQRVSGADPSLIPDLDMYLSEMAGYRSWGKRIVSWPDEKIEEVEERIAASFFDRFPAHAGLRDMMQSDEVANLRNALACADRTRATLRELMRELRLVRAGGAT